MKAGIHKLGTVFVTFLMHSSSLSAETFSFNPWARISADLQWKNHEENEPISEGVRWSGESTLETAPALVLGGSVELFERIKGTAYGRYEHRYLGSESTLYPRPFMNQEGYPDSLVQQEMSVHLGFEVPVFQHFRVGIASNTQWAHARWRNETWDRKTHLSIFPWMGVQWNDAHQSYISFLIEQNLHEGDEERTYKIQSGIISNPSLRLSHIYAFSDTLRFGAVGIYQKLIFEDFWYDQREMGISGGVTWLPWSSLSLSSIAGIVGRDFQHPWKRNGPCGKPPGAQGYDFYAYDAAECYRRETVGLFQVAATWEIFSDFHVSAMFEMTSTHSAEEEFANLKRGLIVSVSWETDKTLWSDPLRTFLPWSYSGHTLQ